MARLSPTQRWGNNAVLLLSLLYLFLHEGSTDFAAVSQGLWMRPSEPPALKVTGKPARQLTCTCTCSPRSVISSLGAGSAPGRISSKEEREAKLWKIICICTDFTAVKPQCHYFGTMYLVLLCNICHFLQLGNTSFTLVLIPSKR